LLLVHDCWCVSRSFRDHTGEVCAQPGLSVCVASKTTLNSAPLFA
jgi:hypothetical protein